MEFGPSVFTSVINGYLPEPHASLLNGILFGISLSTTKDLYDKLRITGLLHIVVLSGMNITILASIIGLFTKDLPKMLSIGVCLVCIVLFVLFVGVEPPIVRAGIMGSLSLLAVVFGRKAVPLYLLFLSLVAILIFAPDWITTISFQLSYGATLGIIAFATGGKRTKNRIIQGVNNELRTSLSAQAFTAPLIWFYFRQISLVSPLANLLVAWTIAPLMIFGFLTAILGKVNYHLGLLPSYVAYGFVSYLLFVIETLSRIPFSSVSF